MRILIFFLLLLTLVTAPGGPARAKGVPAVKPIVVTYDVYVGGIHLLTADVMFEESARAYHAHMVGHTYGFWYKLFPWDTELNAQGNIKSDAFVPVDYTVHDLWGKKAKDMKMHFTAKDIATTFDPPETEDKDKELTPAQKQGALDPVTALLQMLAHLSAKNDCDVTVPVFDGKRRFDVIANDVGHEEIDEADYGIYKGDARTCDARFKAVAGEWTERIKAQFWKKADNGEDREPFHVWLAHVAPDLPELAVRIETGSAWGDVYMHLTKWRPATAEDRAASAKVPG